MSWLWPEISKHIPLALLMMTPLSLNSQDYIESESTNNKLFACSISTNSSPILHLNNWINLPELGSCCIGLWLHLELHWEISLAHRDTLWDLIWRQFCHSWLSIVEYYLHCMLLTEKETVRMVKWINVEIFFIQLSGFLNGSYYDIVSSATAYCGIHTEIIELDIIPAASNSCPATMDIIGITDIHNILRIYWHLDSRSLEWNR